MRPADRPSDRQILADARRRLRSRMPWLPGYPTGGAWQPVPADGSPAPAPLVVDGTALHLAERGIRELQADIADRVLPPRDRERLFALLDAVRHAKTDGDAWALHPRRPRSRPEGVLASAVSWWRLLEPERVAGDLEALERYGAAFEAVAATRGVPSALRLLAQHRATRLDRVLRCLSDARAREVPARFHHVGAQGLEASDATARLAQATAVPTAFDVLVDGLLASDGSYPLPQEPAARAAAVTVLNAVLPGDAAWDAWLSDRVAVMAQWRALAQVERKRSPASAMTPAEAVPGLSTPGLRLPDFGSLAPRALSAVKRAVTLHTLRRLPDDRRLGRLLLVGAAVDWPEHLGELPARLAAPLPWDALLDGWREWSVRRWVVSCPWPSVLAELLESGVAGDASEPLGDRLQAAGHALARTGGDREAAAIVLGVERSPLERESAVAFARSVARGARPLTAPWTADERAGLRDVLSALPERFDAPEVPELAPWRAELTAWLRDGAASSLQQLLRLRPLSGPVLPPGRPGAPEPLRAGSGAEGAADDAPSAAPTWVARVAPALTDACLALAAVDPDAEATAHRLLGIAFPDTVALARELAWLDEALREAGNSESGDSASNTPPDGPGAAEVLGRRRAAVMRLLSGPATLSPVRLARLDADVRRAARRRHLEAWTGAARLAAAHALLHRLGPVAGVEVVGEPDLTRLGPLLEPRYARLLGALRELTRGFQALARDLLRVRLGPPPWDLRQKPANVARLTALQRLGVDVAAWLDAPFARDITLPDGEVLRLELERDPLEVLRMGEHFGTCLSPGGVNFFSAVANAVDAHRGVLFARQADGTPAARMLVCLTDDGGLLSYQLYAHRAEDALEVAFRDALKALSRRLGTPLVAEGRVSLALAPRWYDDGAVGRGEDRRFSPAFLSSLPQLSAAQLVQRAREDLTPEGAEPPPAPLVLQWLLALPDAHLTAEQLEGLAGALTTLAPDDTTWMRVAERLVAHGRLDLPLRWSRSRLEPLVQRALTGDAHAAWGLTLAVEHHPGALLRVLPAASRCSGCPWTRDGSAALWASRAAWALHRQREAIRYLDHAESPDVHRDLSDAESAEARALRAVLSGG